MTTPHATTRHAEVAGAGFAGLTVATALAQNAAAVSSALRGPTSKKDTETRFGDVTRAAVSALERDYDPPEGGFGRAPKFPPSMVLEFLRRHSERVPPADREPALLMAAILLVGIVS